MGMTLLLLLLLHVIEKITKQISSLPTTKRKMLMNEKNEITGVVVKNEVTMHKTRPRTVHGR